ncbi:protein kinase domain-containing protein [Pseudolysinimonas sp.]|jgi:serine/threonine protein kinase|uniref:serine/threonine-protein kinase n=1 Tax=Pseudolysinimonas sp. TaxID=2680009 RepID=UPI003784F5E9
MASDRRPPADPPAIESFRIRELIAQTNYSRVYRYRDETLDRDVVVKVALHPATDPLGQAVEREGRIMSNLSHPAIPEIYWMRHVDGRPMIAMAYYERGTLADQLDVGHRFSPSEVLEIGVRLAGALQTAHHGGLVHADVKPRNILLSPTRRSHVALTDFGIAVLLPSGDITLTGEVAERPGIARARSVPWAPLEVVDGADADPRSDVFSLAATLFALLDGRSPFQDPDGRNDERSVERRVRDGRSRQLGRDVPADLSAVISRGLARDVRDRPASAASLGQQLQAVQAAMGRRPTSMNLPDIADVTSSPHQARSVAITPAVDLGDAPTVVDPTIVGGPPRPHRDGRTPATAEVPTSGLHEAPTIPPRTTRPPGSRLIGPIIAGCVLLALAVVTGLSIVLNPGPAATPERTPTVAETVPIPEVVATPVLSSAERLADGSVVVRWSNPDPLDGDAFVWRRSDGAAPDDRPHRTSDSTLTVDDAAPGVTVCVEVSIIRRGVLSLDPLEVCVA